MGSRRARTEPPALPLGVRARAALRLALLAGWLLLLAPLHVITRLVARRSPFPRLFLQGVARIAGARVRRAGARPERHALLIANHTSWLDIVVLNAATGCAFVSKAEVRRTPLVGWMAEQNRTVYVERSARAEARAQARALLTALDHPQPVALFPEGTTGPGTRLLPFRTTLFEAVVPLPPHVTVRPVAIDYGGDLSDIAWVDGEPGLRNVLRVLGRTRPIRVTVTPLAPLDPHADRKALAAAARDALAAALPSVGAHQAL